MAILKATEAEYEGIKEQIKQTEAALKALQATEEEGADGDGEPGKRVLTPAEEAWIETFTKIERSRLKAYDLAIELLDDEVRAMVKQAREAGVIEVQKFNIIKFYEERKAQIKKKFADEEARERERALADTKRKAAEIETEAKKRARERIGGGRAAQAFSGIAEFAKRIQAAVFQKGEEAKQTRLMLQAIKIEEKQLIAEREIRDAVKAIAPGLILAP